jgi:hypothetical protein
MSSKRRLRRRECTNKTGRYETFEQAFHGLMVLYRVGALKGQRRVYRCKWCGLFHIGRQEKHFKGHRVKQWRLTSSQ